MAKKKSERTVTVTQDPDEPIAAEVLATSIKAIADGMERLRKTPLKDETIVLLVSHASGVGKPDVRNVLHGLRSLATVYLK